MNEISIYRRFYIISTVNGVQQYQLMDPFDLAASSTDVNTSSIVESSLSIVRVSLGFYYAHLNEENYYANGIYEINWGVIYVQDSPQKTLLTRFKLSSAFGANIGSIIETDVENRNIEVDVQNRSIVVEIINNF